MSLVVYNLNEQNGTINTAGLDVHRTFGHDLQISFFEIGSNENGQVNLFVRLDKDDILKELYTYCEDYSNEKQCIRNLH